MLKIFKMFKNCKKGFTLLELLVVVLIIGILASIALPQYEMAVTKAKISSILPIMRRWKDALTEYKLQHGSYCKVGTDGVDGECEEDPDGADLGVNWPSDWKNGNAVCGDSNFCENDTWYCYINNWYDGSVFCDYKKADRQLRIIMTQPDGYSLCYDDDASKTLGKTICFSLDDEYEKICKSIGKFVCEGDYNIYQIGS